MNAFNSNFRSTDLARRRAWRRWTVTIFLAAVAKLAGPDAQAQDAASRGLSWPHPTGYLEVAVPDKYIYHGYIVEDHGPVVQPYLEVFGEFYRGGGFFTSASVKLSIFNSFQAHDNGSSQRSEPMRSWYEVQIEPGVELVFAKRVTLTLSYRRFESPNGAYGSSNGVDLAVNFDDEPLLGACALHPHASWFASIDTGTDASAERGSYFEIGVSPRVTLSKESRYPLTATFPFNVGLGNRRYYFGRHFGFASGGVKVSVPIAFIPANYGKWQFSTSAELYYLGHTPAEFTNDGERLASLVTATLSTEF